MFPFPTTPPYMIVSSLEIVSHAVSHESTSLTLPSGLLAGDLLVVLRSCNHSAPSAVPSGWTLAHSYGNANGIFTDNGAAISYRVVEDASESSDVVSGWSGPSDKSGSVCYVLRANIPISSVAVQGAYGSAGSGGTGNPTVAASSSSAFTVTLAAMGILGRNATSDPRGTSTNFGVFRDAAGGTDPISGSQNYFAGEWDSTEDDHSGCVGYAICQDPESAVNIYVDNSAGNVSSLVTCYLEVS